MHENFQSSQSCAHKLFLILTVSNQDSSTQQHEYVIVVIAFGVH